MKREIRFGSRESELAQIQSKIVMDAIAKTHPERTLRLVTMSTRGDLDQSRPLEGPNGGGRDFFTDTLEQALLTGEVDLCVHSLKDMPDDYPADLPIFAYSTREDPRDALVLPKVAGCAGLNQDFSPVGCSSARRRLQLLNILPELVFEPIRGNVPARIAKMDRGMYGSVVLAMAGLNRLGISERASRIFSLAEMIPAAGQGILAVQGRYGEDYSFLDAVANPVSKQEAETERAVLAALGCRLDSPSAAYARIIGSEIMILGMYAQDGASKPVSAQIRGNVVDTAFLIEDIAKRLTREVGEIA